MRANSSDRDGGGIYSTVNWESQQLVVVDSEISTNTASNSGGGIAVNSWTTIRNTLIAGNTANYGGGIYTSGDENLLQNTTVSGNTALQAGGGLYNKAGRDSYKVDLKNVTLANNTAPAGTGGNITNVSGRVRLANTIVADPRSGDNCGGEITTLGHNIDSDNTCNLTANEDKPGIDPTLAALADNGGRSHTHALLTGSPAINAIVTDLCPDVDQRYYYRKTAGGNCDIGAFESGSVRAQSGQVAFKSAEFFVGEADITATITLTRSGGSEGAVSAEYYDIGVGTASRYDYTAFAADKLIWPDGDNNDRTFEITIRDDYSEEGIESVKLGLRKAFGGATLGAVNGALLHILDDEVQYGNFHFSEDSATYQVRENGGQLNVTVTRSGGSHGQVNIDYATADAEALAGEDYTVANGTLTFAHGETKKTFMVPITDDAVQEGDETFKLTLNKPTWGSSLGFPVLAIATIVGNDYSSWSSRRGFFDDTETAVGFGAGGGIEYSMAKHLDGIPLTLNGELGIGIVNMDYYNFSAISIGIGAHYWF